MPRGKKKATVAEAPPSTPPQAKKRKTTNSTPKGEVKVSSITDRKRGSTVTTKGSSGSVKA